MFNPLTGHSYNRAAQNQVRYVDSEKKKRETQFLAVCTIGLLGLVLLFSFKK